MADKSTQLLLDALSRAIGEPAGIPLHGTKKTPGLFGTTLAAKQLAQRCLDEGYLQPLTSEGPPATTGDRWIISEKGLSFLLEQWSPRRILEDLVRVLQSRQAQVDELVTAAQEWRQGLGSLQNTVERVLQQILQAPTPTVHAAALPSRNGTSSWLSGVLSYLGERQATGDCPLPELYRHLQRSLPTLSIGAFHDGLRSLHEQHQIYLHPWTGPLYEIPEPPFALLVGHEIAYYVSRR